jgi:CRISPR/Cas system CSM-associated protein Csm3 (group 7 of RAMP superfamily)
MHIITYNFKAVLNYVATLLRLIRLTMCNKLQIRVGWNTRGHRGLGRIRFQNALRLASRLCGASKGTPRHTAG